jgi:hypothetical protein
MLGTFVRNRLYCWGVVVSLVCCPGCSVFIQNRYSVFGFESLQTESATQAQTWTLVLLGCVALMATTLGAVGCWFVLRANRRRPEERVAASCSPVVSSRALRVESPQEGISGP